MLLHSGGNHFLENLAAVGGAEVTKRLKHSRQRTDGKSYALAGSGEGFTGEADTCRDDLLDRV